MFGLITLAHTGKAQMTVDIKFFDACEQKVKSLPYTLTSSDSSIHIEANSEIKIDSGFYVLETNLKRGDYYHSFYFYISLSKNYFSDTLYLNKINSGWDGALHPRQEVLHFECSTLCDGELIEIDSNGNVRAKGRFNKGEPNGKIEYFDSKGNLLKREIYRNGYLKTIRKISTITKSN